MNTFIDTATQQIWAFEDDVTATNTNGAYSFSANGEPLQVPATLQPHVVAPPTADQIAAAAKALAWAEYQGKALDALNDSDITVLRCFEHGVTLPAAWIQYRGALRAIVSAAAGDPTQTLPTKPAYPAGS